MTSSCHTFKSTTIFPPRTCFTWDALSQGLRTVQVVETGHWSPIWDHSNGPCLLWTPLVWLSQNCAAVWGSYYPILLFPSSLLQVSDLPHCSKVLSYSYSLSLNLPQAFSPINLLQIWSLPCIGFLGNFDSVRTCCVPCKTIYIWIFKPNIAFF